MERAANAGCGYPMGTVRQGGRQADRLLPGQTERVDLDCGCILSRRQAGGIPGPGNDGLVLVAEAIQVKIDRSKSSLFIGQGNTYLESLFIQVGAWRGQDLEADLVADEETIIRMEEHLIAIGDWPVAGYTGLKSSPARQEDGQDEDIAVELLTKHRNYYSALHESSFAFKIKI